MTTMTDLKPFAYHIADFLKAWWFKIQGVLYEILDQPFLIRCQMFTDTAVSLNQTTSYLFHLKKSLLLHLVEKCVISLLADEIPRKCINCSWNWNYRNKACFSFHGLVQILVGKNILVALLPKRKGGGTIPCSICINRLQL